MGDFGVKNGQFWMKKWIYLGELQFLRIFFEGKNPNVGSFVMRSEAMCGGDPGGILGGKRAKMGKMGRVDLWVSIGVR